MMLLFLALSAAHSVPPSPAPPSFTILDPVDFKALIINVSIPHYDNGSGVPDVGIAPEDHYDWAVANAPFFECDDEDITRAYHFRWYSFHNHIDYANGVVTEFYPSVPWAERDNAISCAAGHHIHEGRWLRDDGTLVGQYLRFWFIEGGHGLADPEDYTFWAAHSAWAAYRVSANETALAELYPALAANFWAFRDKWWNAQHGCLWRASDREGEENSVGGDGCRPVSNSVMYGEADALARIAATLGNSTGAAMWAEQAALWRTVVTQKLWSDRLGHFVTLTVPAPAPPPPPPPPGQSWSLFSNNTYCCDQSPCIGGQSKQLWKGRISATTCLDKCEAFADGLCRYATLSSAGYCLLSQYCNATDKYADGSAATYRFRGGAIMDAPANAPADAPGANCPAKGRPSWPDDEQVTVREIMGYSPWYFQVPDAANVSSAAKYAAAFEQLADPQGFSGPWGLRTCELRAPCYNYTQFRPAVQRHECNWNGPSWPYETCKALTGLANLLNDYPDAAAAGAPTVGNAAGFTKLLRQYARQHTRGAAEQGVSPWIGEVMHPDTGAWLARQLMYLQRSKLRNRGIWYNHSTFIDLIIAALVGLRTAAGSAAATTARSAANSSGGSGMDTLTVFPLAAQMKYFALDNLRVRGHSVTVAYDEDGTRYATRGGIKGLGVWVDGKLVASTPTLAKLEVRLK